MKKAAWMSAILALGITNLAHAGDDCNNLDDNLQWRQLFQEFSEQFRGEDYQAALKTTEKLQDICDRSPILNYSIAQTYQKLDNRVKSVMYYQKATEYADEFKVKGKVLEMFWYARYEAEHPENIQYQKELADSQQTLETLNVALEESRKQSLAHERASEKYQASELGTYKALMWIGISVGAAGLGMAATGSALMIANKGKNIEQNDPEHPGKIKVKDIHNVGVGLLSAGVVATITGALAAGFGGVLYSRNRTKEDETVSFQVGPTGAVLTYQF